MAENEEELKSLLRVKEESEKAGLKLNIQKTKVMASSALTSRQIEGEKVEAVTDFIFLGPKITAECDSRQEIKSSILKSRDITLPTKVHSQSYDFSRSYAWM